MREQKEPSVKLCPGLKFSKQAMSKVTTSVSLFVHMTRAAASGYLFLGPQKHPGQGEWTL